MLHFLPIPQKIVALPEPRPPLPSYLEQEVEQIWQTERVARGSTLFNGPLFSLEEISSHTLRGRFVEYRLFLAQERRPELFSELRVQPLAVTGVLQNPEGIFFGYRDSAVAVQADCWELLPSGGIDHRTVTRDGRLCPAEQVLTELWEEVGITETGIAQPKLICFTEDPLHHIFELIWELKTPLDKNTVLSAHSVLQHPEHSSIRLVRWADLEDFLWHGPVAILPASRDLLDHLLGL